MQLTFWQTKLLFNDFSKLHSYNQCMRLFIILSQNEIRHYLISALCTFTFYYLILCEDSISLFLFFFSDLKEDSPNFLMFIGRLYFCFHELLTCILFSTRSLREVCFLLCIHMSHWYMIWLIFELKIFSNYHIC